MQTNKYGMPLMGLGTYGRRDEAGIAAIPASSQPARLASNFAAQHVALTADELATIAAVDRDTRRINPATAPEWD